ncbi:MAG: hypothetical protein F4060_03405 [Holophagales bacterium]|nr:hypothetical protein [Holophagales bacterium]MYI78967.1 hypothetical protein [Holophagales bacterium]
MSANMANEAPLARSPVTAPPASGSWRRFWRPSHPPDERRDLAPNLSWRELVNRSDAHILDIRSRQSSGLSETLLIALIDTTGAARFVAMGRTLNPSTAAASTALPWPEVHGHLVQALESASVVLTWDASSKAHLLARIARSHGLSLPPIPWRDLRADYRRFGYPGDSLTAAAKRHVNGALVSGPLASCHLALAVMKACGR